MPIGSSAGRSSRNRRGSGATERATSRQRAYVDPPAPVETFEQVDPGELAIHPHYLGEDDSRFSPRVEAALTVFAWSCWAVTCVLFALVLAAWFGLV